MLASMNAKKPKAAKAGLHTGSRLLSQILAERWNPLCPHSSPQLMAALLTQNQTGQQGRRNVGSG